MTKQEAGANLVLQHTLSSGSSRKADSTTRLRKECPAGHLSWLVLTVRRFLAVIAAKQELPVNGSPHSFQGITTMGQSNTLAVQLACAAVATLRRCLTCVLQPNQALHKAYCKTRATQALRP